MNKSLVKDKVVIVTGASKGIGLATSLLLVEKGAQVILAARNKEALEKACGLIEATGGSCILIPTDIRQEDEVKTLIAQVVDRYGRIDILINNAGNAHGYDLFHEGNIEDWEAMIDINFKGLLYVSKAIVPGMVERGRGHIINLGSIAGKEVYPKGNVYCASKYAVDAISSGMRLDLNNFGIKVSEINPGMVETEFALVRFKGDAEKAKNTYRGLKPLTGGDIAEIILFIITRPEHVNISDVIVFPTAQASATVIKRNIE